MFFIEHEGFPLRPGKWETWHLPGRGFFQAYRPERPGSAFLRVTYEVRCRGCPACKQWKSRVWMARAVAECEREGIHTYFGTLTFSPAFATAKGISGAFDTEDAEIVARREMTLALKRFRKLHGQFRYFATLERGEKRGRLHWHCLLHTAKPLQEFVLPSGEVRAVMPGWIAGFFDLERLVGEPIKAAAYVAKYITEAHGARVRASQGYGDLAPSLPRAVRGYTKTTTSGSDEEIPF
ncbi:replication associated protein [Microviridae sp.]|nr:replication associated protein [Microviridae sp.]UOF82653.1 replication associated protein [Microviridae sp.]UOF82694.1 replication associated protein [Microviridae sp.]